MPLDFGPVRNVDWFLSNPFLVWSTPGLRSFRTSSPVLQVGVVDGRHLPQLRLQGTAPGGKAWRMRSM